MRERSARRVEHVEGPAQRGRGRRPRPGGRGARTARGKEALERRRDLPWATARGVIGSGAGTSGAREQCGPEQGGGVECSVAGAAGRASALGAAACPPSRAADHRRRAAWTRPRSERGPQDEGPQAPEREPNPRAAGLPIHRRRSQRRPCRGRAVRRPGTRTNPTDCNASGLDSQEKRELIFYRLAALRLAPSSRCLAAQGGEKPKVARADA